MAYGVVKRDLIMKKVLFDVLVTIFIFTYFYKLADLNQLDITMTDLSGADLRGSKLRLASLNGAKLTGENLTGAKVNWGTFVKQNTFRYE